MPVICLGLLGGCGKSDEPAPAAKAPAAKEMSSKEVTAAQADSYKETMHRMHPDDPKFK